MREMSKKQRDILQYLARFIREHGYPPSIRQIQAALSLSSTSVVDYNLERLVERGLIQRQRRASRSITFTEKSAPVLRSLRAVPLLGAIAAGEPIPAPDTESLPAEVAERVELPAEVWPETTEDLYALRVEGNSMIDAFIADGDIVILRHRKTAANGQMVAAWLPEREEVTLKRFYKEGKRVRLQPENPDWDPIYVDSKEVQIQGQVVGVIRSYR